MASVALAFAVVAIDMSNQAPEAALDEQEERAMPEYELDGVHNQLRGL